jgi:hypothetical protein
MDVSEVGREMGQWVPLPGFRRNLEIGGREAWHHLLLLARVWVNITLCEILILITMGTPLGATLVQQTVFASLPSEDEGHPHRDFLGPASGLQLLPLAFEKSAGENCSHGSREFWLQGICDSPLSFGCFTSFKEQGENNFTFLL